eukprot:CAMPEP_0201574172 /NCGR_PEP_ID=MMETSP0190_2-20130828/18472_1 /ASSEMBLY_ACC=CAM_ASM_000263 /TAXON_ID=37353 /ORGANISM="Rosalina sp." /LENGTH=293 /DNA_ID=CAMNT_0048002039 /DNA_START=21 /DNA_END=902 /DNA_ORIENTATION=+
MSTPTQKTSSTPSSSKSGASRPTSSSSRGPSSGSSRSGKYASHMKRQASGRSGSKRVNVHKNVHIKQEDPAIWEHFRARTVQGTSIYIGKNTIIGPGVNIIAEKGTITIGDNNIISEGTLIINKNKEELVIGNGNVFECGARIEAAKINDYNVFGAKCHVMSGALIGTGCVICPRVMIIAKKRIRDCMVVFGDNMVHEQPLMKKRNRAYIDQMVKVLRAKFKEIKQKPSSSSASKSGGHSSSSRRGQRGGAHGSLKPGGSSSSKTSASGGPKTVSFGTKSRAEKPLSSAPPKK